MFENLLEMNSYGLWIGEIIFLYFLIAFLLSGYARREMFNPIPFFNGTLQTQSLKLPTGQTIIYQMLGNPEAAYVILYSHGNRTNISYLQPFFQQLVNKGFAVLAYDYPGYGHSQGKASESSVFATIELLYDILTKEYHFSPSQIIAMGRSLGSGPTLYIAEKKPVAGVILDSAFISIYRTRLPFALFPFDIFKNLKRIKNVKAPTLFIHGKKDTLTPFHHGISLYNASPAPKEAVWVEEGHHNNLTDLLGDDYYKHIQQFIKEKVASY